MAVPRLTHDRVMERPVPGWAVAVTIPEELLNLAAAVGVGEGVDAGTLRHTLQLPMMGDLELCVGLVVTAVSFTLDGERPLLTVVADGAIEVLGESPVPLPTGPMRVIVQVRCDLGIEVGDNWVELVLDLPGAELVSFEVDQIGGLDPGTSAAMGQMIGQMMGVDLFESLALGMGTVRRRLEGVPVSGMGVEHGPAALVVGPGFLVIGFPATDTAHAGARPLRPRPGGIGLSVADSAVSAAVAYFGKLALKGTRLPVDVDVLAEYGQVESRIRSRRIVPDSWPDLRPALRAGLAPRLEGDRIVVHLSEAWVELPSFVPSVFNEMNRFVGSAVGLLSASYELPAAVPIPLPGGESVALTISRLRAHHGRLEVELDTGL